MLVIVISMMSQQTSSIQRTVYRKLLLWQQLSHQSYPSMMWTMMLKLNVSLQMVADVHYKKVSHVLPDSLQRTTYIKDIRYAAIELNRNELDLVIMGQLAATINTDNQKRSYTSFLHGGQRVCKKTFAFLHGIGKKRLHNVIKHYLENGYTGRRHGNLRRKPHHALSLDCVKFVVMFILNYSELHGLVLPGRVPGYSRSDIQLLPSSTSKHSIWQQYYSSSTSTSHRAVAYSTFCLLWRNLVPQVMTMKPMKPMSDLCWTCQQNSSTVIRMTNASEGEKSQALQEAWNTYKL